MLRVGVDSGGTFTDVCLLDEASGRFSVWKVSSTPADPSLAIAGGAREALERLGPDAPPVGFFGHGTTVATNALIQGRGARCALVTSAGFRDLLELARQRRPHLYDLQADKPLPLVPRDRRLELDERLLFDGTVLRRPAPAAIHALADALREMDIDSVAVCFLYSFVDPVHERAVVEILRESLPGVYVTASHEVCPEFREYERLSTTVVNAFLGPVMRGYLSRLSPRLAECGIAVEPLITQSNGGTITFESAADLPVRTVLSGPSTGVIGAVETAGNVGVHNVITFDMGGTSTDVALVERGRPGTTTEAEVHGYPIKCPMIDIHTVGAGGGSIAHVDSGGFLKVGPRSAGADPGPVCYGLGNDEPTVTDANVVLQVLNPESLLGGRMPIDRDAAARAVERLGRRLGLSLEETAAGIIRVVTANMARAIRLVSVQRGHDPRDYCLMPFGGGGPLHSGRLARELSMGTILVPPNPGILCALGLLLTDLRRDFSLTRRLPLETSSIEAVRNAVSALVADARGWLAAEKLAPERWRIVTTADMRYAGQNYELNVSVPEAEEDAVVLQGLRENFERAYERQYGYTAPGETIEVVTFRVEAYGVVGKPRFESQDPVGEDPGPACRGQRPVYDPERGGYENAAVFERELLRCGNVIRGPAIVEQMDSTTLLLAGQRARVDPYLNLLIEEDTD